MAVSSSMIRVDLYAFDSLRHIIWSDIKMLAANSLITRFYVGFSQVPSRSVLLG